MNSHDFYTRTNVSAYSYYDWEKIVSEYENSNLSADDFCAEWCKQHKDRVRISKIQNKANCATAKRDRLLMSARIKFLKCKDKYTTTVFDVLNEKELIMLELLGIDIIQHTEFSNEPKQVWMALEELKKVWLAL